MMIQPLSWCTNLIVPSKESVQEWIEERERKKAIIT
jgi:hypothetical protein